MKTILMICPFAKPNIGGVESHLEKLIDYLSKREYKVILVTYQPLTTKVKGARCEKRENIEIYRTSWFGDGWFQKLEPYFPLVFIYLFPGLFFKSLFLYIRKRHIIDTIHAHGFISAAIAKILVRLSYKRCVVSTHAIYNLQQRRILASLVKWMLKDFNTILAVGEPSKRELIQIGLDERKIKVHPNWIDINTFHPLPKDSCRKSLNLAPEDFIVLFIGRLMEKKGVLILLDVAKKANKSINFVFIGNGSLSKLIQDTTQVNGKVKYYGKLGDNEIIKAYNAADIFVSPVLYEEGFATVYLEALACGIPVITAKRGCLPYFLAPEVADLLETVNTESVLRSIEYYYENRDILYKKRNLCRMYAEQHFSDKNAEIIVNSY